MPHDVSGPSLVPLPLFLYEGQVRTALIEDFGRAGDITSAAIIPTGHTSTMALVARQKGVLAGLDIAETAFKLVDPTIQFNRHIQDGERVNPQSIIATVTGSTRALLGGERTALNFLGHLSGIASVTASIADAIIATKATVICTRKTTPGLRSLEKYAVRAGGGSNHRFGLDDAILIKDNHIAIAGSVREAIRHARAYAGHMVKIEVEVDTFAQLEEALSEGIDVVLLDNMSPAQLTEAVQMIKGRAISEASGRVTPQTAPAIAASGVDFISVGWLTHSAAVLDIGLDVI